MAIQNKAVITAVHSVGMTVLDVDRSIDFYSRVLPFEMVSDVELFGLEAFYSKDPDGHNLEILQFHPDKGDAKWQRSSPELFLGIDHTAIVVRSTDDSLAFYRDVLGFRVAGESENFGIEQERLNNVPSARLRITTLKASSGPGIEFLEYVTPRDGRPIPMDHLANDVAHWQTVLVTDDVETTARALRASHTSFVSPGPVLMPDDLLGFTKGVLVRDPTGHIVGLVEQ